LCGTKSSPRSDPKINHRGQKALDPTILERVIRDLATLGFLGRAESLILCRPVGVGKSHIAQALGCLACQKGCRLRYVKAGRLLADLGGGHADGKTPFSRRVVGWAMGASAGTDLVMSALNMAVWNRRPGPGVIHHSHRD